MCGPRAGGDFSLPESFSHGSLLGFTARMPQGDSLGVGRGDRRKAGGLSNTRVSGEQEVEAPEPTSHRLDALEVFCFYRFLFEAPIENLPISF